MCDSDPYPPVMQGMTQAPPKLSERDLITAMERHGIGTDATVADHIKKQLDRGYAIKDHAALFSPSPLGEALIAGYHRMGLSNLWQPNLRSAAWMHNSSRLLGCDCGMRILLIVGSGLTPFPLRRPSLQATTAPASPFSGSPMLGAAHHACLPSSQQLHALSSLGRPESQGPAHFRLLLTAPAI